MEKQDADIKADYLIEVMLKGQPNLLANLTPHADSGKDVGEFIAALHAKLSEAYQKRD